MVKQMDDHSHIGMLHASCSDAVTGGQTGSRRDLPSVLQSPPPPPVSMETSLSVKNCPRESSMLRSKGKRVPVVQVAAQPQTKPTNRIVYWGAQLGKGGSTRSSCGGPMGVEPHERNETVIGTCNYSSIQVSVCCLLMIEYL